MPVSDADFFFMFILFIGSIGFAAVGMIFTILLGILTPSFQFLKARLRHKSLLAMRRRDRKIEYVPADIHIEGLATNKKYKTGYIIDPKTVYHEKKSGVAILPVNSEVGITLGDKEMGIIDALKQAGYSNIEEAFNANLTYGLCKTCGFEGFMEFEKNDKNEPVLYKEAPILVCPFELAEEERGQKEKDNEMMKLLDAEREKIEKEKEEMKKREEELNARRREAEDAGQKP